MLEEIVARWMRAAERASEEGIRVIRMDGQYVATSASRPMGFYRLSEDPRGWQCECVANGEYGLPCKHLWVLAEQLGLDLFRDVALEVPAEAGATAA